MNKYLIPLVILLGSLLYSAFWNKVRRQHCDLNTSAVVAPVATEVEEEPEVEMTEVEKALFKPIDVYFQSGSNQIIRTPEIDEWLALAKEYLDENPGESLSLTGHTDSDGTDAINQPLSERRAAAVRDILVANGFSASNLQTFGKSSSEPIGDNSTAEGKAKTAECLSV